MNELRTRDPFDLEPLENTLRSLMRPWHFEPGEQTPQIRIDLAEHPESYAVKAEIPGVRKEDIDVRIDRNQVTISAEVKRDKEEKKNGRVLRSERQYGFASRSFSLASEVDDTRVDAKYQNGVLELVLPKKATASSKRVTIA